MKKCFFGEVIASLESGERMDREAANQACLRELRRNNQARGVVCTPRAWMCLNGGGVDQCLKFQIQRKNGARWCELGSNIKRAISPTCQESNFVLNLRTAVPESSNL